VRIFVAKAAFHTRLDGRAVFVQAGDTAEEGNAVLAQHPQHFVALQAKFKAERETKRKSEPEKATAPSGRLD